MADILADTLQKYIGPGSYKQLDYSTLGEFDRTQFNPEYSLGLMRAYNDTYNLGLTDEQLAKGITDFGTRHKNNFGVDLDASSNPVAVAAESVERALSAAGKDSGAFWAKASPYLSKGEDMAQQNWNRQSTQTQLAHREATKQSDPFGELFMSVLPAAMSAVGGPLMGAVIGGSKAAGTGGDFADVLKGGLLGGGLGIALGGGLDSIANGTPIGNWLTSAGNAGASGTGDILTGGLGSSATGLEGYGLGTAATSGLGSVASQAGGNAMDLTDILGGWSDWGDAASTVGNTAGAATGDITGIIDQLQTAVSNGSMTLDEAMAQLQTVNNTASGGSWLDYLNSGSFPSEATGAVSGSSIPDWLKNAPSTIQKLFGIGTGAAAGTGTGTGGFNLLGALLGGGLGALGGGSKQAGTTTTTQTPWGPQQPYLLDAWSKAKAASEAGNPLQTQANSNYQSVLGGPTVNPMLGMDNPYLAKQIDNANSDVTRAMMPAMNQANKASGSFGNSGVADQYGKALTDAYSRNANDMRYKDYYAQQQLQKDAVGNTLGFTTGANQFNAAPAQEYAKTVQGTYGGSTTSPYFTNPTSNILGGATLGSQIGKLWG